MNDGGPAFPFFREWTSEREGTTTREGCDGMSLRDWFAGQAIAAAAHDVDQFVRDEKDADAIAKRAYMLADAMLAAREKQTS